MNACDLCEAPDGSQVGGLLLWRDALCRVVLIEDAHYPGFCRVILNRHLREMTDLPAPERQRLMGVVFAVEEAVRAVMAPDKMNLASLGNQSPHVHWHVIPRWSGDRHFPWPIWAAPRREPAPRPAPPDLAAQLSTRLTAALGPGPPA